jgi:hypothetical protein
MFPFTATKGPGKKWFNRFMKRHSEKLSLRKSRIYEVSRDIDRDESLLLTFYDEVKRVLDAFKFEPENIWNCDETGVTAQGKSAGKVMAKKVPTPLL